MGQGIGSGILPNMPVPATPSPSPQPPDIPQPLPNMNPPQAPAGTMQAGTVNPNVQPTAPGPSKAEKLLTILRSGLQGALAGRAATEQAVVQSGGRRSGGAGMGFVAAENYPIQHALEEQQLRQSQAQTGLTEAEQSTVNVPGVGPMPAWLARTMGPAWLRQQGQLGAAQIGAGSREAVAQTGAQSRENVANIAHRYMAVPNVGLYDTQTRSLIPGTQQGVTVTPELAQDYGLPQDFVGKPMNIAQLAALENVQTNRAPKMTTGESVQTDAQGNLVKVPTTHVTQPILPNNRAPGIPAPRQGGASPNAAPSAPRGGGVRPVTDAQGNPVKSAAGAKNASQWVSWDENGRTVAGPMSMAQQRGAHNFAQVPGQEVRDIQNARNTVQLLTKQGDPNKPETQGVLQLIDSLDKDGKLGVLASRWNSFMTRGVGASPDDDPRIITLINKNMLSDTSAMLAHFGAGGGRSPQMLQHFLDLANSGKMDGVTLRAGEMAIADYMRDRAMIPSEQGKSASQGQPLKIIRDPQTQRIIGIQ